MKKKRFSVEQTVAILEQVELGMPVEGNLSGQWRRLKYNFVVKGKFCMKKSKFSISQIIKTL